LFFDKRNGKDFYGAIKNCKKVLNQCKHLLCSLLLVYIYIMRKRIITLLTLVCAGALLISAGSILINYGDKPALPEKEMVIAFRQIGHEVMLHAGDSTSKILSPRKVDNLTYRLSFISDFSFVPDSLVKIVGKCFSSMQIIKPYVVNVIDCKSKFVVYGFQIGHGQKTTLVPCLGREQEPGCYIIEISFLADSSNMMSYGYALAIIGIVAFVFVGKSLTKNYRNDSSQILSGIQLGNYTFIPERRILKHANQITELSDKENKLLKIFAVNINQPVTRDMLMKEVWEDEGVIVGRSLDVFVSKLRKKLKDDSQIQLINIHGVGYSLEIIKS